MDANPPERGCYIIYSGGVFMAYWNGGSFWNESDRIKLVTHWMALPPAPAASQVPAPSVPQKNLGESPRAGSETTAPVICTKKAREWWLEISKTFGGTIWDHLPHPNKVASDCELVNVREVLPGEQESHDQEQYENACKCPKCGTWVIYFNDERGSGVECAHLECDWIAKVASQVPAPPSAPSELDRQGAVSINELEAKMKVYNQALSQWHIKAVELRADLDRANGSLNQIAEAFGLSKESNEALVIHAEKLADNAGGEFSGWVMLI